MDYLTMLLLVWVLLLSWLLFAALEDIGSLDAKYQGLKNRVDGISDFLRNKGS